MTWARVRDWLAGAVAMLVVLLGVSLALLWAASDPVRDGGQGAGSQQQPGQDRSARGLLPSDLGEDDIWYSGVELSADSLVSAGSRLRDVRAVAQDVVTRPGGLVTGSVVVEATVPFGVVEDELGDGTTVRAAGGGQASVARTVEALGRELRVVATGTVEVQRGSLVVVPRSIGLGGSDVLGDAIADTVRRLVTITYDVRGLPEGFALEDVAIQDDGFRVRLRGDGIQLVQ